MRFLAFTCLSLISAIPALAQYDEGPPRAEQYVDLSPAAIPLKVGSTCDTGGLVYDDGGFENGLRPVTFLFKGDIVQRFDLPAGLFRLDRMCTCFSVIPFDDSTVNYDLRVWAANGPNGAPGTLLAEVTDLDATGITLSGSFYGVNVSASNFTIQGPTSIYVGPSWLPGLEDAFVCTDESATTTKRQAYLGTSPAGTPAAPTGLLGTPTLSPNFRALGMRVQFTEVQPPSCVPDATTLCLTEDRFKVQVTWKDFLGATGTGKAVDIDNPSSGLFYFFTPDNLELLIKVLDGCGFNDRFWVYFAATTDVEFEVTVTDTRAPGGVPIVKKYTNALGHPASAVTDAFAFSTCP